MQQEILSFRDLEVWQESMSFAVECYRVTAVFPKPELYGLTSQIRRAAVSIPANIAEGHPRPTNVYRNHVSIALGSQAELGTVLEVSLRVGYLRDDQWLPLRQRLSQLGRRLNALRASLGGAGDEQG